VGCRSIPISTSLIIALKTYKRKQLEDRMKIALDYQNFDLVFRLKLERLYFTLIYVADISSLY